MPHIAGEDGFTSSEFPSSQIPTERITTNYLVGYGLEISSPIALLITYLNMIVWVAQHRPTQVEGSKKKVFIIIIAVIGTQIHVAMCVTPRTSTRLNWGQVLSKNQGPPYKDLFVQSLLFR